MEKAKHLLETSDVAIERIAAEVGYDDPTSFRCLFKGRTGVTPARHRQGYSTVGGLSAGKSR